MVKKQTEKKKGQKPEVIFQPYTHRNMQKGIRQMANLIRPTLGPIARVVAVDPSFKGRKPELLDSGATILRRMIQLQNRDEDMGAMFFRHLLWEMYENVGDGTTTAGVLFESIYNQGIRYITAGGNAMILRGFLEEAGEYAIKELDKRKFHIEGKESLTRLALTICHDPELAKMMGEIFDVIGAFGRLEIRTGRSRELEREYIEGIYWDSPLFSREMFNAPENARAYLEEVPILVTDLDIKEPDDLIPVLDLAVANGIQNLVLMAAEISDRALGILLSKINREKVYVMAIKAPGVNMDDRLAALEDIAILTGGLPLHRQAGDRMQEINLNNMGKARRAWANLHTFVLVGGKGDPRRLRQHIHELRAAYQSVKDPDYRKKIRERIGKLMGGSATLWIGDTTPLAVEARKELAEHTAEAMRGAMRDGVIAGGGTAFRDCCPALKIRQKQAGSEEERAAYTFLIKAFNEPTRIILDNAGLDSNELMVEIRQAGSGWGYDVLKGRITEMDREGLCDSAAVTRQAVFSAVHGAALVLTTDVLIHRRIRPESISTTG